MCLKIYKTTTKTKNKLKQNLSLLPIAVIFLRNRNCVTTWNRSISENHFFLLIESRHIVWYSNEPMNMRQPKRIRCYRWKSVTISVITNNAGHGSQSQLLQLLLRKCAGIDVRMVFKEVSITFPESRKLIGDYFRKCWPDQCVGWRAFHKTSNP